MARAAALVPPALLVFYVLAVDRLGFLVTAATMVLVVALALGARLRLAVPLALACAPLIVHLVFSKLLRVPLPAGLIPDAVVSAGMSTLIDAFALVLQPDVLLAILLASIYGLVVGSLPGLSATMATALLVPVTFYLSPIAAVATIIAASAMAIFSGDIPGALLRIPGTPASAAYTDEAYAMTRKGQPEMALGIGLWFSALGGIAGTLSLMVLAPPLAEMALNFSTYEYFWLAFLGLMCATLVARSSPVKAIAAMLLGLLVACIGMENPAGTPRFTFGDHRPAGRHRADPGAGGRVRGLRGDAGDADARAAQAALPALRQHPQGAAGADAQVREAAGAGQHRRHHHRRAAGRRRRHGGVGQLRHVEALLQGAREVRHRASRGADRGRRQQQRVAGLGLGAVAAVRHSRRHHHRHRHRRALHEGAEPRPDAVHASAPPACTRSTSSSSSPTSS